MNCLFHQIAEDKICNWMWGASIKDWFTDFFFSKFTINPLSISSNFGEWYIFLKMRCISQCPTLNPSLSSWQQVFNVWLVQVQAGFILSWVNIGVHPQEHWGHLSLLLSAKPGFSITWLICLQHSLTKMEYGQFLSGVRLQKWNIDLNSSVVGDYEMSVILYKMPYSAVLTCSIFSQVHSIDIP